MFVSPGAATGDTIKPSELHGHLLIVKPTEAKSQVQTKMGPSDAVVVDVVALTMTDPATGQVKVWHGGLWFSGVLVNSLKGQLGQLVLARMGQGTAKPGMSPPWVLDDATGDPQAVAAATAWIQANPGFQGLTAPAPTPVPTPAYQVPPVQTYQHTPMPHPLTGHPAPAAAQPVQVAPVPIPVQAAAPVSVIPAPVQVAQVPTGVNPVTGELNPETAALIQQMQLQQGVSA